MQGHVTQSVQSQLSMFAQLTVHVDELVQASWHCILTVKGVPSAGTSWNAISAMLRVLALYSTVIVFIFVSLNAFFPIGVQLEMRLPQLSLNTYPLL